MNDDEAEIRELVRKWQEASQSGDAATILELMTDDAVFTVAGREPFGKEAFAAMANGEMPEMSIEGSNEIVELQVNGDWAFTRNHIEITMTMPDSDPVKRSGYTLTLFRKESDGKWRLARDANLLTVEQ